MLLRKPLSIPYIFNKVKHDLLFVLIISLIVYYLTHYFQDVIPDMPLMIPTFIGTAISILLSFKLNQSYDRWWEARKIWGSIVNDSRSLVLQLQNLVENGNDEQIKRIAFRQIAWCYSLGQALRVQDPAGGLNRFIPENEIAAAKQHQNVPLALLGMHARDIRLLKDQGQLDTFRHMQLDDTLVRLCDSMGRAERIKNTVFPATYRLFLHLIIYLFVITLSIALQDIEGIFEIPLLIIISAGFFLLEKSATHMQDPFENRPTDTAMTAIARSIETNIKQLLGEPDTSPPQQAAGFYLL